MLGSVIEELKCFLMDSAQNVVLEVVKSKDLDDMKAEMMMFELVLLALNFQFQTREFLYELGVLVVGAHQQCLCE